jgi:hypothetical protein
VPEYQVSVKLTARVEDFQRGMIEAAAAVKGLTEEIDHSSDRTAWLAQGILALAPAAVTLGAGAVPAIAGIATQMTITAAAAGVMGLAFHGVGKALLALNSYQLTPTAANLAKLHADMANIGPDGAQFVHFLQDIGTHLNALSNTARAGVFPGLEDGIRHLLTLSPQVNDIVSKIASGIGELASEAGKGLSGSKFEAFFAWLDRVAKPVLLDMGRTVGNLAEGLANMLVAFSGQSLGFSHGLLQMSRAFAEWSRTLDHNQSFQSFLAYIDQAGPKALDFLGAFINAATALLTAWAPVGKVMLPMLTHFLNVLATILDTPLGPATLGILALASAYGRLRAIGEITSAGIFTKFSNGLVAQTKAAYAARVSLDDLSLAFRRNSIDGAIARANIGKFAKGLVPAGVAVGGLGLLASGAASKMHLTNTAALAMAGTLVGPWGAAVGGGIGLIMDLASRHKDAIASIDSVTSTLNQQTGAVTKNTAAYVANQLQQAGILDAAAQLNLSLPLVTKAALGNKDAITELNGALDAYQGITAPGYTAGGSNIIDPEQAHAAMVLRDALGEVNGTVTAAQKKQRQLAEALHFGTDATHGATKAQKALTTAQRTAAAAASTTAGAFITIGKDVDNAKVSLQGWIHQLEKDAQALEDFGNNAKRAADKGLRQGLIAALEAAGPTGAMRMKQLANASDSEIRRANKAWLDGQKAIRDYTAAVTSVPNPKINVDISQAMSNLRVMQAQVDQLHGKTIIIRTTGGHVTYDTGGYTGAGPKMAVRGVVHAGEVVIPQDLVSRDWAMLKARYGYLPGFANGGLVSGAQPANRGGTSKVMVTFDGSEVPVRGTFGVDTGAFEGTMRVIAREEFDADSAFAEKRANQ